MTFSVENYMPFDVLLFPGAGMMPGHGASSDHLSRNSHHELNPVRLPK